MNDKWVLQALPDGQRLLSDGFYTGKSYIYQGAKYAAVDCIENAKQYTSYSRAVNATKKQNFENYRFEVKRLSELKEATHEN